MSREPESIAGTLRTEFGPDMVITEGSVRTRFANDLAYDGTPPLAVAAPVTMEQLQAIVRTVASLGVPFAPVIPNGMGTESRRGKKPPGCA